MYRYDLNYPRYNPNDKGMSNSTKNNSEFIEPPFHIDKYAVMFLYLNK